MRAKRETVSIIGLGYMGLPTACLFARAGFLVRGVDKDARKIEMLKKGTPPFEEKGLAALLRSARKNIDFSVTPTPVDMFVISVPTPITKARRPDLSYVEAATRSIVPVLKNGDLVVIESTVSPGVCGGRVKKILDMSKKRYFLAHCPERAFPGETIKEMIRNDRIIGGVDGKSARRAEYFYRTFVKGNIFLTDIATAETVKLLENAYRGVNIAFANEMAKIADTIGVNVWRAIKLANRHPRVNILKPGPGVGGHCIPIDPWFLATADMKNAKLLVDSLLVNEGMGAYVARFLEMRAAERKLAIHKVAIMGVAYKSDVDDARETPALHLARALARRGYGVRCTDPYVKQFELPLYPEKDVLVWADAAVIITDHARYRNMNFRNASVKLIVDTRNVLEKARKNISAGIHVVTLGDGETRRG